MGKPDNPIDIDVARALAALRSAAPPAGMEDRILQRLDARLAEPHQTPALRSAWLRGALTGAFAATAVCAALFFVLRAHHAITPQTRAIAISQPSPTATPVALSTEAPCSGPSDLRVPHPGSARAGGAATAAEVPHASRIVGAPFMHSREDAHERESTSPRSPHFLPASFAPSHPAPPAPLTAQERALEELARNATPAELASLRPKQKSDAERQADFDSFFAPSPEVQAIDDAQKKALGISDDEPAQPNSSKEGSL